MLREGEGEGEGEGDGDGIGTSATRASIISELKRREFLETKGKQTYPDLEGRPDYSKGHNGPAE